MNRINRQLNHIANKANSQSVAKLNEQFTKRSQTLTVIDNRNGNKVSIPIDDSNGMIDAKYFGKQNFEDKDNVDENNGGLNLCLYDPGYINTASATSRITFIDGDNGILTYRGYSIEELAEKSSFMEVSFLLLYGELPSREQLDYFSDRIMKHTFIHQDLVRMMTSFRYDAHPMGIFISTMAAMSTLHPEANPSLVGQTVYDDRDTRNKQIHRLLGNVATIAAFSYRHRQGRPYVSPSHQKMTYTENFLYMLDRVSNASYMPNRRLARALDILFILHADHELNCSTAAMRHLASSGVDVYTAVAGATAALYGPRHGGANEAVLRMLESINGVENVPNFVEKVKQKKVRLMGFGHRIYRNYDPRAKIIMRVAKEVFDIVGYEPLTEVAIALEKYALNDQYFIKRRLYPNIDFYSGLIYRAMGFPTDFFPVLFAIPRTVGQLAHQNEFIDDAENRIVRPRQKYLGEEQRAFVKIDKRVDSKIRRNRTKTLDIVSSESRESKRRYTAETLP